MSPHEFSIPVHDLDAAGKAVQLPIRASWLRSALEGTDVGASSADGSVDLRVSKSGVDVVIRGTVRAELTVPCARCLEPARVTVREELSALAVLGSPEEAPSGASDRDQDDDDRDRSTEDANTIAYDGETVVLDDLVRDELLLAIPMIPLCSESCPGISAGPANSCGADEPGIDPRLRPLLKLKKT
jgi:uncharacterized protein